MDKRITTLEHPSQRKVGRVYQPLGRAIEIAVRGFRTRIGRSLVTLSGIVLAVTLLSYIATANAVNRSLAVAGDQPGLEKIHFLLRQNGINIQATLQGNPQDYWLIVLSLLTCAVGITNAMLMSVTERFREIGTMKCLGALDGFILKLFIFESTFLGVVGSVLGVILGLGISLAIKSIQFGGYVWQYMPVVALLKILGLSLAVGTGLSTLGACYPAYIAAKMEPVEALRVEE